MDKIIEKEWIKWMEDNEATETRTTIRKGLTTVSGITKDKDLVEFELID